VSERDDTTRKRAHRSWPWIPILPGLAVVLLWAPCWTARTFMTNRDSILRLPLLSNWRNVPMVFSQNFMMFSEGIYRPMTYAAIAVLRTVVPAEAPWVWRTLLIALYVLNAWLMVRLAAHFVRQRGAAVFAGVVLLVHPLASVFTNQINDSFMLLGGTFYLAVLLSYVAARRGPAVGLFVAGLLTSRMLVSLPLFLLVYELLYRRSTLREAARRLWPFLLLVPPTIWLWREAHPHPLRYAYSGAEGGAWPSFLSIVADSGYYAWGLLTGGYTVGRHGLTHTVPLLLYDTVRKVYSPTDRLFIRWATVHLVIIFLAAARVARKEADGPPRGILDDLRTAERHRGRRLAHAGLFLLEGARDLAKALRLWRPIVAVAEALGQKTVGLAVLLMYIGLLPFLSTAWYPVNLQYVCWRCLYVPLLGLALAFAALADRVLPMRRSRAPGLAALALLLALYGARLFTVNVWTRSPVNYWWHVVDMDPRSETAQFRLGEAYLEAGDPVRALHHLFTPWTSSLKPSCRAMVEYYVEQGDLFAASIHAGFMHDSMAAAALFAGLQAPDYAESTLGHALGDNPYNTKAMRDLALVFAKKGLVPDARRWLRRALEIDPGDAVARERLAALDEAQIDAMPPHTAKPPKAHWLQLLVSGRSTRALRDEIIAHSTAYPDDPVIQMRAGHCLLENGDLPAAMAVFQKAHRRLTSYTRLATLVSYALAAAHDPAAAIDVRTREDNAPNRAVAAAAKEHYDQGVRAAHLGKLDEAIVHLSNAITIHPGHARAHYVLGLALSRKGELDTAIYHYSRALQLDPQSVEARTNLGNVYARQQKLDQAIEQFKTSLAIKPDDPNTHYNLAVAYFEHGDYPAAAAHLQKGIDLGARPDPAFVKALEEARKGATPRPRTMNDPATERKDAHE